MLVLIIGIYLITQGFLWCGVTLVVLSVLQLAKAMA